MRGSFAGEMIALRHREDAEMTTVVMIFYSSSKDPV
jgi:hypothetical protein